MTMQPAMRGAWSGPTQDDFAAIERLRARHAGPAKSRAETADQPQRRRAPVRRAALLAGAGLAVLAGFAAAGFWATGTLTPPPASVARQQNAPAAAQPPDQAARKKLAEAMRTQDFSRDDALRPTIAPAETAAFRARAASLIAEGRIAGARAFLERAADGGDQQALFELARTFDPQAIAEWKAVGVAPDEAKALALYRRAAAAGSTEAATRAGEMGK